MAVFTVPAHGGGGGGAGPPGPAGPAKWSHPWGYNGRVPSSGIRALRPTQGRTAFDVGIFPEADSTLTGLTISLDVADGVRDYILELILDPTSAATVVASLALPAGTRQARVTGLAVAIAGVDYGLQVRRTSGIGQSTFTGITATANGTIP